MRRKSFSPPVGFFWEIERPPEAFCDSRRVRYPDFTVPAGGRRWRRMTREGHMVQVGRLMGWILLVTAPAWAATPYQVNGLHTGLVFREAVKVTEEMGGTCELGTRRRGEFVVADCAFPACGEAGEGGCDAPAEDGDGRAKAQQPGAHPGRC